MRAASAWTCGLTCGVAIALLLDPAAGNRRRRRMYDAGTRLKHRLGHAMMAARRDITNRTRGVVAGSRRMLRTEHPDEVVLKERVRAALGHVTPQSHAITIHVHRGNVVLDGPIPAAEVHRLIAAVRGVAGVADVETRFDPHLQPALMPSPPGRVWRLEINGEARSWPPAMRTIIGGTGAALVGLAALRRGRTGLGLAAAGAALVARSLRPSPQIPRAQRSS